MFGDECRETRAIKTRSNSNGTVKAVKVFTFSPLKMSLLDCQKRVTGTSLQVDFKKPGHSNRLTDLFTKTGLTDMLEGAGLESVDMLFSFLGVIEDESCGLDLSANVTKVCRKYASMVNHFNGRYLSPDWTTKSLVLLCQQNLQFESLACKLVGSYHSSKMGTQNQHVLDRICDALRDVGDVTHCYAGLFGSHHKKIERAYQLTWKSSKSVMSEFIERKNRQITYNHSMQVWSEIDCKENPSKQKATKIDGTHLVRTAPTTTIQNVMRVQKPQKMF